MPQLFGRTNVRFPAVWLSPRLPNDSSDIASFGSALSEARTVLDVSGQPALWGSFIRRGANPVMAIGHEDVGRAVSERHAADLLEAHLFQTLSSIGRETLDFYFLPIRHAWEEFQLTGAFGALEAAREEGHVRFIGLAAEGSPLAALGVWQFHDAFEALLVPNQESLSQLGGLAKERRVGVVARNIAADARLATVTSTEDVLREMGVVTA